MAKPGGTGKPGTLGVGIVGCGDISAAYMSLAPLFREIDIRACADIQPEAARKRAEEFGLRAESIDGLLVSDDVDIIVNLTPPAAHYEVARAAISAGKHLYSEKPFVLSLAQGRGLLAAASKRGVRIGSAPDTFLGGAHQLARHLVDRGAVGRVTSGTCFIMDHGMEHWHPNPDFFFKPGGGPVLDMGPYYITNLVQLIGPVRRVMAMSSVPSPVRTVTSQPNFGHKIEVATPTTVHSLLEFVNGATVMFAASWDVRAHSHPGMELYGEEGTLHVPDPNFFGGAPALAGEAGPVKRLPAWNHPLSVPNRESGRGAYANYRGAGLADMALAIMEGRPHRCSPELALHVVEVMTSILKSGEIGRAIRLSTTCERPAPLDATGARVLLKKRR